MDQDTTQAGQARPVQRRRALRVGVVLAVVVTAVTLWLGAATLIAADRDAANRAADRDTRHLAVAFEDQVRRQLLAVDQSLRILADDWARNPAAFDLQAWQPRMAALLEITFQTFVTDAEGRVVTSTLAGSVGGLSAAERDYFRAQAAADSGQLFISTPLLGRLSQRWALNLSRRLTTTSGAFAGIIAVSFDANALVTQFRRADIGPRGLLALVGADGRVRAAVAPEFPDAGQDVSWTPLFRALIGNAEGNWVGRTTDSAPDRRYAFQRVGDLPLHVVVGIAAEDVLAPIRPREVNTAGLVALLTAALGGLALLLLREVRRSELRQAELAGQRAALRTANADLQQAVGRADEKTALLETTLGSMSDGVSVVDGELRLVAWNRRFVELAGIPPAVLRAGVSMADILRAQARAGEFGPVDVEAEVARRMALSWGPGFLSRAEREKPDGRVLELRRASLPGGGFVTLYADITERRRVASAERAAREAAEAASNAKSAVVAFVSHEVRTPLGAMLGAIELLQRPDQPEAVRRIAGLASDGGQTLLALVNDLLDLSRIEAGRLLLESQSFDLPDVLSNVAALFRPQAEAAGSQLEVRLSPELPRFVTGDPRRLRQVVGNLISNALKFAGGKPVDVTAQMRADRVEIRVRDRGPGIPPAQAEKLFEPFERLESSRGLPGTGLGLAICRRLVGLMGGEIGVAAAGEGGGAAFWLLLPLPVAATPEAVAQRRPAGAPSLRVLLADDSPAGQRVAAALLQQDGHLVEMVGDGQAALAKVSAGGFDIALLDVHMPLLDGRETASRIRALPGRLGQLPLIALTGSAMPGDRERLLEAGMDEVLVKPVPSATLLGAVARLGHDGRPPTALLDQATLGALEASLGAPALDELLAGCLRELRERLPALEMATDATARRAEAHAMAGAAAGYGLGSLATLLRAIEAASRHNQDAAALITEVAPALTQAEAALAARRRTAVPA